MKEREYAFIQHLVLNPLESKNTISIEKELEHIHEVREGFRLKKGKHQYNQ